MSSLLYLTKESFGHTMELCKPLLLLCILTLCSVGIENGNGEPLHDYSTRFNINTWKYHKYGGKRVCYYPNSVSSFQLLLLQAGDINPNPGPSNTNVEQNNTSCGLNTDTLPTLPLDAKYVYNLESLLAFNTVQLQQQRLNPELWRTLLDLGVSRRKKTRRGRRRHRPSLDVHTRARNPSNLVPVPKQNQDELIVHLWNCNSLRNKTTLLFDYILENRMDIMFLTETWMRSEDPVVIAETTPDDYTFISVPRRDDPHGGVAVIYKSDLNLSTVNLKLEHETYEYVCVTDPKKSVHYVLLYRPPPSARNGLKTVDFLTEFDELSKKLSTLSKVLLLGDFNIHVDIPTKPEVEQFMTSLSESGFIQHVRGPTHRCGHTLDLVISNSDCIMKSCQISDKYFSDHHILVCKLDVSMPRMEKVTSSSRNYKVLDKDTFTSRLAEALTDFPFDAPCDDQTDFFNHAVTTVLDDLCPMTKRSHKFRSHPQWYNEAIYKERRLRRKLERVKNKNNNEQNRAAYLKQVHLVCSMVKQAKSVYFNNLLTDADIKKVFSALQSLLNKSPTMLPVHTSASDLADRFALFFKTKVNKIRESLLVTNDELASFDESPTHDNFDLGEFDLVSNEDVRKLIMASPNKSCQLDPLPVWLTKENIRILLPYIASIVNTSLNTGLFPSTLKEAILVPLIKKPNLDCNVLTNYRPVSNVPFLSKIIEKVVLEQLKKHLDALNLHDNFQSAYRKHHSTETALLRLKNDILQGIDGKKAVFVVILDLSSAFDLVDHKMLIQRMQTHFGISGTFIKWMKSYLSNRNFKCKVAAELSTVHSVGCGVPQGSVLGPQLFSCYIEPVSHIIKQYNIQYHMYADDITLYSVADPKDPEAVNNTLLSLSNCVQEVQGWMQLNMLKLNYDKTEFIVFSSPRMKHLLSNISLEMPDSATLFPKTSVKILGVTFDSAMKMDLHVTSLCRSLHYHLSNISRIRPYINKEACGHAVRTLISTRLDYANSVLFGIRSVDIKRLQRVQNRAAKLVFRIGKREHATPLLQKLHWLPIDRRISYKILTLVYKCFRHNSPSYLRTLMVHRNSRPGLRSSSDTSILQIPRSNTSSGDNAFTSYAPKLWNALPLHIRQAPSLETFKKHLKTHLFIV